MLYHLAEALVPQFNALNVFTYHTVRAGGAALTGFVFCLFAGPWIIRMLQSLKIGQFIKKEHVADLHALHKGKAGTPTMGGTMIIASTVLSLLLWSTLTNRLLWLALGAFVLLGVVGFVDDLIKLKRKHNDGLSARAKFAGQILTGTLLGVYLVNTPITVSGTYLQARDVLDWPRFAASLLEGRQGDSAEHPGRARLWEMLDPEVKAIITAAVEDQRFEEADRQIMLRGVNRVLDRGDFYDGRLTDGAEAAALIQRGVASLSSRDTVRLNRLLLEAAAEGVAHSVPNVHTKLAVPGFKDLYLPLGLLYIPFVIFVIVAVSNAVNLTDGLDGLAAGASIVSLMAYAAIAYVVSRADWSQYLFVTYVPEASELFVFGGALLGTGLGFLWFNSHPAEVFMGDTGSLALGGAIATMAILTKQELLLPLVAGIFVVEAASVVIQVASFKLTGRRVFRMAPLHHHFELLGWTETKVVMRFWIIALLFALMSLATLKLR